MTALTCEACHKPVAGSYYSFKHKLTGNRVYHGCAACLDQFGWSGWREYQYPPAGGKPIATRRGDGPWVPLT